MDELRRRGRPFTEETEKRNERVCLRLRDDELKMLEYLANFYGISMSDVLRLGIKNNYELHKQGHDIVFFV